MTLAEEVEELAGQAAAHLAAALERLDDKGSAQQAIESLTIAYYRASNTNYAFEPEAASQERSRISAAHGEVVLETVNRLLILHLVSQLNADIITRAVPKSIVPILIPLLGNIVTGSSRAKPGDHSMNNDRYKKDLAICLLRLQPIGAELADVNGGIPRRAYFGPPVTNLPSRCWFLAVKLGGLKPLFNLHLDRRLSRHFNPEGYELGYKRLADLLKSYPDVKGVWSEFAWFLDPALKDISPELAYLKDVPLAGGAILLAGKPTKQHTSDAIRWSPKRRQLFESGDYVPIPHGWLWARDDLLRFVEERVWH